MLFIHRLRLCQKKVFLISNFLKICRLTIRFQDTFLNNFFFYLLEWTGLRGCHICKGLRVCLCIYIYLIRVIVVPFWYKYSHCGTLKNKCKWSRGPWNVKIQIFSQAPQWPPVYIYIQYGTQCFYPECAKNYRSSQTGALIYKTKKYNQGYSGALYLATRVR